MMRGEFKIGAVLHHRDFPFEDGTTRNKYLVLLGANPGCDYLAVLTTSKIGRRRAVRGCHHTPSTNFFLPGGETFFARDTWLVLSAPRIIKREEMITKGIAKIIELQANLHADTTAAIRNCLRDSKDISSREMALL